MIPWEAWSYMDCKTHKAKGVLNDRPPAIPRLTAELFTIPLDDGNYIIYAPLRRAAFVGNGGTVNFIASLKKGEPSWSFDPEGVLVEFLRRVGIVDGGEEIPPIVECEGDPLPTAVTLYLTTACNLRCTYCYAAAGDLPAKFMSLDVAKKGIDFVAANAAKKGTPNFEIAYHGGGEPTVNWQTITKSHEYARAKAEELGLGVLATTATNGFLPDDRVEWIISNLQGASISFDGLPAVHDKYRPTMKGEGSSGRVMATIRRFDETDFPYGIRVTVTADQIPAMADSVEFICANFKATRIQVEPSYQIGRWAHAPTAETRDFIAAFREAQLRAEKYGRQISYSAARLGTLTTHFCGISQDSFALSPDGNVSSCYEVFDERNTWSSMFFYGQPNRQSGGYDFDLAKLNHLRKQAVHYREYCRGCFAKWTCAGDCYHKSLTVNDSIEFSGSDRCNITRELTKDQILGRIAASGGIVWQGSSDEAEMESPAGTETIAETK